MKNSPEKSPKKKKVEFAGGDSCVNCGEAIKNSKSADVIKVTVQTRSFPVCGETCRRELEDYIEKDKKLKKFMYLMVLAAAVCVLISAISGITALMGAGIAVAGLAFLFLPYPISMFETFKRTPVRSVKNVCRVIGVALVAAGIFFVMKA